MKKENLIYIFTLRYLLFLIFLSLSFFLTIQRNIIWQNDIGLWLDVVKKSQAKARAHSALGDAYKSMKLYDQAMEQYKIALKLNPEFAEAHNNLGVMYGYKGIENKAIKHYQTAIKLKPEYIEPYFNLAVLYIGIGDIDKARGEFENVLEIKPDHYQAQRFLDYIERQKN